MTPRRTLLLAPARIADALPRLPFLASLARSGRVLVGLFREGQEAFEPTLLRWRKENAPAELSVPTALTWGEQDGTSFAALRALGCEEAVLLEPGFAAGLLARRLGIRERWGYAGGLGGWLLNRSVARPADFALRHLGAREKELAQAMMLPELAPARLDIPRGWPIVGRERLERAKLDPARPVIGIYAGKAGGASDYGWPRKSFEELIRLLRKERSDLQFVLLANLDELWPAVQLFEKTGKIHPVIGPELTESGKLALLSALDLLIAADSSQLHLAGALGIPTVGLYEREAALRRPAGEHHAILERQPLRLLPPEDVGAAALALLAAKASAQSRDAALSTSPRADVAGERGSAC